MFMNLSSQQSLLGRFVQSMLSGYLFFAGITIAMLLSASLFVWLRMLATYSMQREIASIEEHLGALSEHLEAHKANMARELDDLKTEIYGPLGEATRRTPPTPGWILNRFNALDRRMLSLEQERYSRMPSAPPASKKD